MDFIPNNVSYRSSTSKAFEIYYNSKAFMLNQLVEPNNGFGQTPREILLLMFNKHAEWIHPLESYMLSVENVYYETTNFILDLATNSSYEIGTIIDNNPESFDVEFVDHWRSIKKKNKAAFIADIREIEGENRTMAFPKVVDALIEYLNNTLFELYEVDCILGSDLAKEKLSENYSNPNSIILRFDDSTVKYHQISEGENWEVNKLKYYIKNVVKEDVMFDLEVKNYAIRSDRSLLEKLYKEIKEYASNHHNIQSVQFLEGK